MDNLVPPLEICKQLKEAGFPQKSYFYYAEWNGETMLHHWAQIPADRQKEAIAAPTAQEIADQLPTISVQAAVGLGSRKSDQWLATYDKNVTGRGDTMAEALAALYLKLQEVK